MIFSVRILVLEFVNNSFVENELASFSLHASCEDELIIKLDLRQISLPNDSQDGRKVFVPKDTEVNVEETYGRMMLFGEKMHVIEIEESQLFELTGPQMRGMYDGYAKGQ